jgi:DNA-directed RNA polymerase specialized sigma24 family protein
VPQVEDMVTALYGSQYRSLVRLAVLLLGGDVRAAEEIAQASFVALHGAWPRPRDGDAAIAFLRRAVVSRSRQLRRPGPMSDPTTATNGSAATTTTTTVATATTGPAAPAGPQAADPRIMTAVRALPYRQREAVVLRLFLDLADGQAAAAMGVTTGALRGHAARAMTALRPVL